MGSSMVPPAQFWADDGRGGGSRITSGLSATRTEPGDDWYSPASLGRGKSSATCALPTTHVDRTFLFKVFSISAARKFLRAVHDEQLRLKFRSNTRLTKGVLCPEKSIRSIKSSSVR